MVHPSSAARRGRMVLGGFRVPFSHIATVLWLFRPMFAARRAWVSPTASRSSRIRKLISVTSLQAYGLYLPVSPAYGRILPEKGGETMSNKELAVQLYSAFLQSVSIIAASPNCHNSIRTPTLDEMVEQVGILTEKLSCIQDK